VELSDAAGNLIENDHLDLLDYLIDKLEKRGISVIITAQTNFGNGYPERNINTGAYSYNYGKCEIHANPEAIKAQQRYVEALVAHKNPYTGKSYADDRSIIALEINNEPCHQTSPEQVTGYINSMVKSARKGGWKKPLLYNVSHNMEMVPGYYAADIQGTTYQWYPIGLVSGHEQKGNFLPYVDNYAIPFADVKGFGSKAKVVYEFDPADMLDSYIFPAVARTFAREGFQWATQFAYDPIDMARFNTEYQTHFLNLAYTPQKALGMRIAAHAMKETPVDADTGKYPADTVFGDITVSYKRNLALLNSTNEYVYTNNVDIEPVAPDSLRHIAGYGTSPVAAYDGRGAYFIDRIDNKTWRLEMMPDVLYSADPFAKPSLDREVAHIIPAKHTITLNLPGLSDQFTVRRIAGNGDYSPRAAKSRIDVSPGVYLLSSDPAHLAGIIPDVTFGTIKLNEYVCPPVTDTPLHVNHLPQTAAVTGKPLTLRAEAFGKTCPDSLVVYPSDASFWREDNRLFTMKQVAPYIYETVIPAEELNGKEMFSYRIAAVTPCETATFPGAHHGAPLDWDAPEGAVYTTRIIPPNAPVTLLDATDGLNGCAVSTIPDEWGRSRVTAEKHTPVANDAIKIAVGAGSSPVSTIVTRYIGDITTPLANDIDPAELVINTGDVDNLNGVTLSLVDRDGFTYSKTVALTPDSEIAIKLNELTLSPTLLCPAPFPTFLNREFVPEGYTAPLSWANAEKLQMVFPGPSSGNAASAEVIGVWMR
ncbi:MAG: hypothetical protein K2L78_03135, partial [Muribaculaceae bacterium]|nr:hypothetical protein [Muribaculaceae bacterium]